MSNILSSINSPGDLKKINKQDLDLVAQEIRAYLLSLSDKTDIHLSSNLGIVEIAIGSIYSFNMPNDKILYDTGHQCYTHKILTGRYQQMQKLRQPNGISGFPLLQESQYDLYGSGHSGSAISVAMGLLENNGNNDYVVVMIGDASIVNGQSFEALNNFDNKNKRLIIVLNDNGMSISKSIGSIAKYLNKIKLSNFFYGAEKTAKKVFSPSSDTNRFFSWLFNTYNWMEQKISGKNLFQLLGYQYLGPIDGNNIKKVIKAYDKAKWYSSQKPVVLHFKTRKGLGLIEAQNDTMGEYHSFGNKHVDLIGSQVCNYLIKKTQIDKAIHVINPAMCLNCGMSEYATMFPNNYHDVGIAEEHAISFAAGMKMANLKPIVSIYSTFLQRGIDQIISDWSNMNINNLALIDRADLSTGDGISHHGIYDIGLLKNVKNATIVTFRNNKQMQQLIDLALNEKNNSYFIRYPKQYFNNLEINSDYDVVDGDWENIISNNNKTLILSYGPYINLIEQEIINKKMPVDLINAIYITNYNELNLKQLHKYEKIIVYERCFKPQLGNDITNYFCENKISKNISLMAYNNQISFGKLNTLDKKENMDIESIFLKI